ncbi:wall-associated receptor kinase 2-like [Hibiscus syriacus]|uniref:Wall-associated receptor kinase 2-like n=1 Tax=Hibiscus syriacus TaxID=106335 RepID=A0A6A3CPE3_HIBSY|nr:beta-glucosidase BoGH3B-like [Hibiscus syriacus]KAE8731260.1 wall-associated receptor kinase 2-like [Hibiscus syriacus]
MTRKYGFPVVFVFLCFQASISQGEQAMYKDPMQPIEARITDLLGKMTLEEKVGQMTQIERENATANVMTSYFIGSVLSGGGSVPKVNATAKEWVDMVNRIQQGALSTRLGIPMIYGIDAVHGHNNVVNATIFPHNVGLGVTRDPQLVKAIGAATAFEVRATGIPYAFAPCIAVCRDPRWGRCYESYSEDHKIVQQLTTLIDGLQGQAATDMSGMPYVNGKTKVAGCSKHYVGDGGTANGINENNTIVDDSSLYGIHMPAYVDSMAKGIATVMASYSSVNGVKMHANEHLLTDHLKDKLGFQGFVISDWEGIDRITSPPHSNYTYSIQASITAGVDMVMVPYQYIEFINGLVDLVKKNVIPMSRIDDAVTRILRVKFAMGLFDNPVGDYSLVNEVGSQKHRELAREAVRKSLVLLKNGKPGNPPLLPLPKNAGKILVTGTHADNLGYQCGGWTIEWQGVSGNNWTAGTTILDAVKKTVDKKTKVVYKMNPSEDYPKKTKLDFAIVVVGEVPYAETRGDSTNLTIPDPGPQIIENACKTTKCVVVLISGRPVVIQHYLDKIDALVAAWLPGSEGQGVADVLFGDFGFTGKLARTWFKSVDQLPMNVGDPKYDPLFPFGFGLETQPKSAPQGIKREL